MADPVRTRGSPPEDPRELVARVRSATLDLARGPAAHLSRAADHRGRIDLATARAVADELARAIFFAERAATPAYATRARVVWRGWAIRFGRDLRWESRDGADPVPLAREPLGDLAILLSGPAPRGELRALDAYEALFVHLFSLGWALAARAAPGGPLRLDDPAATGAASTAEVTPAWLALIRLWEEPWSARRHLDAAFADLARGLGHP